MLALHAVHRMAPAGTITMTILETSPPALMAPLGVKPKEAARLIGGSRSEVYRLLRQRRLRAVKRGASLLVLTDSIREHMASLPPATFGAGRTDARPAAKAA
jgi:excisionase family DNA binding protein